MALKKRIAQRVQSQSELSEPEDSVEPSQEQTYHSVLEQVREHLTVDFIGCLVFWIVVFWYIR